MISAVLGLVLISSPWQLQMPDPYFGFGIGLHPQWQVSRQGSNLVSSKSRTKVFILGLPMELGTIETQNFRPMTLFVLPEVLFSTQVVNIILAVGPEMEIPLGYRQIPSHFVWGAQFGFVGGILLGDNRVVSQRQTLASALNLYIGPQFEFGESFALKLLFGGRIFYGVLQDDAFQASFSDNFGFLGSGVVQADF